MFPPLRAEGGHLTQAEGDTESGMGTGKGRPRTLAILMPHVLSLSLYWYYAPHLTFSHPHRNKVCFVKTLVSSVKLTSNNYTYSNTSEDVMDNLRPVRIENKVLFLLIFIWLDRIAGKRRGGRFKSSAYLAQFNDNEAVEDWERRRYLSYLNVCSKIAGGGWLGQSVQALTPEPPLASLFLSPVSPVSLSLLLPVSDSRTSLPLSEWSLWTLTVRDHLCTGRESE